MTGASASSPPRVSLSRSEGGAITINIGEATMSQTTPRRAARSRPCAGHAEVFARFAAVLAALLAARKAV